MKFDYWHQRRYFRLDGSDEDLPFGAPPFVVGPVVTMPEPVWQSLLSTVVATGTRENFPDWSPRLSLGDGAAAALADRLVSVIGEVQRSGRIVVADNIADGLEPDAPTVSTALDALSRLLRLAAEHRTSVRTWVE